MSLRTLLLSSPWRAHHFDLLREFYRQIAVSREVLDEVTVAGAGLPGADEMQRATWIQVHLSRSASSPEIEAACAGLGAGERSIIVLASELSADLVLIDEGRARRAAKSVGLTVAGSIAILERGARLGRIDDLRSVYLGLLDQGIRYDRELLNQSLGRLGFARL